MSAYRKTELPRIVVVGSGMAGMATARALRSARATVLLVDAHNYTTFPPLLFQVATCFLSPDDVARPVRGQIRKAGNVAFRLGRVENVDWDGKRLLLDDGGRIGYDYLALAAGVMPTIAAVPGAAKQAIPLKAATDAARLRNSLLRSFESAARDPERSSISDTSIAVIGGGPTGVELSGYVADFLFHYQFSADYPQLDPAAMRVTLVERGDRLLPGYDSEMSRYALTRLRRRGVEVQLDADVVEVDSGGITTSGGDRIPASTVVWAGGVDAAEWVKDLGVALDHGRVVVEPDLRAPGHPDTFVVGDLAAVRSRTGALHPQVAQVAIQTGRHAGRQIRRLIAGRPTNRFSYFDKGTMAMVGRNAAVVQVGRLHLTGRVAWIAWGFLHLGYLPGTANRMTVGLKYLWWHFSHENANRVLLEEEPEAQDAQQRDVAVLPDHERT